MCAARFTPFVASSTLSKLATGRYHRQRAVPTDLPPDLIERAFREPLADFVAWRALSARVRPRVRRRAEAECDRLLGALAGSAGRAEALPDPEGRIILPSAVAYADDGSVTVGHAARAVAAERANRRGNKSRHWKRFDVEP